MAPNQAIFDGIINNSLNILRLAANKASLTLKQLEFLEKEMVAKLAAEAVTTSQKRRVETFFAETNKIIENRFNEIQKDIDFPEIANYVASDTVSNFEIALGSEAIKKPSRDYFKSLKSNVLIQGSPSADWWRGQSEDLKFKFAQQVRQGLGAGETNQQIISRIVGKNGEPGVMVTARRNAAALVQTSVQTVANDARRATFQANSDVIKGIRQVSTLDGHTSLVCISYSEAEWDLEYKPIGRKTLPFNGGVPRHFNCRSVEVPITKTFAELGLKNVPEPKGTTRASSEGQIDVNTSFDDFLKRKGTAYQNKMLGEGRADLWRDGKITLKDLVDGKGRPLTLAELQKTVNDRAKRNFTAADYMKKFDDPNVTPENVLDTFPADTAAKIRAVNAKNAKLTATNELYKKDDKYTKERVDLHNKILYEGVQGYDPDTGGTKFYPGLLNADAIAKARPDDGKPTFTLLGGRGGSGKSAFSGLDEKTGKPKFTEAKVYNVDRVLLFDSDKIKHMLPEFKGFNAGQVHEESSDILALAMKFARDEKLNIVLDGTLKSPGVNTIKLYKQLGYRTEAHYMHLPRKEAAQRAVHRFLSPTGRYVPAKIILENTKNEINFDELLALVDDWSFRDNNVARNTPPILIASKFPVRK